MTFSKSVVLASILAAGLLPSVQAAPLDSIYVDLAGRQCVTRSVDQEHGVFVQRCPGVGGYGLVVEDFDGRQSVSVERPDKTLKSLDYDRVITSGFFTLGPKAEWRVDRSGGKLVPVALIIRVIASEDPVAPDRKTSYLAVARISSSGICVTDRIRASATMNEEARHAADASSSKPCL